MNIIDAIIFLIILMGAVVGFKNGVIRQTVSLVGFLLVVILAFILKNPLSLWMYEHLPFFNFWGILKGVTVINILLYEMLAFLILLALFAVILRIILFAAKIIEKILDFTIILGIPSKILGLFIGALEYYLVVFVLLYVVTLPIFNIKTINDSLSVVNNDSSSIILVTNNDKQKYEEVLNRYNIKIDVLDNDFIGGCKLKNDKFGNAYENIQYYR